MIYLAGSMKNPEIEETASLLRAEGYNVFDDWRSGGPEVDDRWQEYERARGRSFREALNGRYANNAFNFDLANLDSCDVFILQLPCGKSGHIELGYMVGRGKPTVILMGGEPERFDLMYKFANHICVTTEELLAALEDYRDIS